LRLPAESIRDAALLASGLLDPTIGGRSVRPPQPAGVAELGYANSVKWVESQGSDRYRRGLYIHFQRTVPYPQLINFDAPDANLPACNRERSTTPLQALNLLNDPVFVEAARALAVRALEERPASNLEDRIRHLSRLTLGRASVPAEVETLTAYFRSQTAIFENDREAVDRFFPIPLPGGNRIEAAALAGVSSVLLNVDEFIRRE
jgi:hypothetical protein